MIENDLEIYDVWESDNGNIFIKIDNEYSIAIGPKNGHSPNIEYNDLKHTQYVKSNNISTVKKIGKIIFD